MKKQRNEIYANSRPRTCENCASYTTTGILPGEKWCNREHTWADLALEHVCKLKSWKPKTNDLPIVNYKYTPWPPILGVAICSVAIGLDFGRLLFMDETSMFVWSSLVFNSTAVIMWILIAREIYIKQPQQIVKIIYENNKLPN